LGIRCLKESYLSKIRPEKRKAARNWNRKKEKQLSKNREKSKENRNKSKKNRNRNQIKKMSEFLNSKKV